MDKLGVMDVQTVKQRMNEMAGKGRPFLFAVNFEMTEGLFIEDPLNQQEILFKTPLGSNINSARATAVAESLGDKLSEKNKILECCCEPYELYSKRFDIVENALMRGDTFLTNLSVRTPIKTPLSFEEIVCLSNAPYCICVKDSFVCFSPERFVLVENGEISTNPMKGTIDADIPNAASIILNDSKETNEHNTVVDLLRNDLGIVASDICVKRFRYIDKICTGQRNILQVSSQICGRLKPGYLSGIGNIIFKMLPAGSVSGAPKQSTVNIIKRAEGISRGYYTGVFGYFNGSVLDSAVLIRFIEKDNGRLYFRSGGGITVCSNPQSEYNEVMEKIYLPFV